MFEKGKYIYKENKMKKKIKIATKMRKKKIKK
jgi:hypothetical protein